MKGSEILDLIQIYRDVFNFESLKIIKFLREHFVTVRQMSYSLDIDRSTLMKHLSKLEEYDIVTSQKIELAEHKGRMGKFYTLNDEQYHQWRTKVIAYLLK